MINLLNAHHCERSEATPSSIPPLKSIKKKLYETDSFAFRISFIQFDIELTQKHLIKLFLSDKFLRLSVYTNDVHAFV